MEQSEQTQKLGKKVKSQVLDADSMWWITECKKYKVQVTDWRNGVDGGVTGIQTEEGLGGFGDESFI